jgi:hypothetical protein
MKVGMVGYRYVRDLYGAGSHLCAAGHPLPPRALGDTEGEWPIGCAAFRRAFSIGPGIVRYVLMQHVQGQITVERLLAQLKGLGVCNSKGQIVTILTASKDAFHAEKDAIWRPGWKPPTG